MVKCPICDSEIELPDDTVQGEILECDECGSELEVTGVDPYTVGEAPNEEEDWDE